MTKFCSKDIDNTRTVSANIVNVGSGNSDNGTLTVSGDIILRGESDSSGNNRKLWFGDSSVKDYRACGSDSSFFIEYESNNDGSFQNDQLHFKSERIVVTTGNVDAQKTYITLDSITPGTITMEKAVTFNDVIGLKSYTVAGVPAATTAGRLIYVSNESGGAIPAFSDGTNWRRMSDRAIVS